MINSKGIKILCYIIMALVAFVSLILIFVGVSNMIDKEKEGGMIWIFAALLLPFVTTISLYPIFALANIDENLSAVKKWVEGRDFSSRNESASNFATNSTRDADIPSFKPCNDDNATNTVILHVSDVERALNFINVKYKLSLSLEDEYETIKEEVASIEEDSFAASILKNKIAAATNKAEVLKILIDHRILYGY